MSKGDLSRKPDRNLKILISIHILWGVLVFMVGLWWGSLVVSRQREIAELETQLGVPRSEVESKFSQTKKMIYWESGTFVVLLVASSGLLLSLYSRDLKRSRSIQAFFASLTHELRTPLTSIRLQAESIADSIGEQDPNRQVAQRLLEDTSRLETQVERTLELARVEGGGRVDLRTIHLASWLDRMIPQLIESYRNRIEVRVEGDRQAAIQADPSSLSVIFRNLFENSVKHAQKSPCRSVVEIHPAHAEEVEVVYRDDGKGIQADSSKIGRLFYKGPQSSGAGVGLYLVTVLMNRMSGRVDYGSPGGFEARMKFVSGAVEP